MVAPSIRLQPPTAPTALSPSLIRGNGSDVLNAADLHASTGQGPDSGLAALVRGLLTSTAPGPDLDVEGVDAQLLAPGADVGGGLHGGVDRVLVTVGLDLHAAGDADDGFLAGEIGDVDKGVVGGGEEMADAEDDLVLGHLGPEADDLFLFDDFLVLGSHFWVWVFW